MARRIRLQAGAGGGGQKTKGRKPTCIVCSALLISKEGQPSLYDMSPPESLRSLDRARTLTVLRRLDSGGS